MPIPIYNPSQNTTTTSNNLTSDATTATRPSTGSAGRAPADALSGMQNNSSGRGQDANAPGQELSREQADRLYEESIEEEYAKREGGA